MKKKIQDRVYIKISNACNARCVYCFQGVKHKGGKINLSKYRRILKTLIVYYEEIVLFGGEPFLAQNLSEIEKVILLLRHKKLIVFTNGYFRENERSFIKKHVESFEALVISLDGLEETHNRRRPIMNVNGYNTILDNIHFLLGIGLSVVIQINVDKDNIDEVYPLLDCLLHKYNNVPKIVINRVLHSEKTLSTDEFLFAFSDIICEKNDNISLNSNLVYNLKCEIAGIEGDCRRCNIRHTRVYDFESQKIYCCPENANSVIGFFNTYFSFISAHKVKFYAKKPERKTAKCKDCNLQLYCEYGCNYSSEPEECRLVTEYNLNKLKNIIVNGD